MSITIFCDLCGTKLGRNAVSDRITRTLGLVKVEVLVAVKESWNAGHVCVPCVERVIAEGVNVRK